MIPTYGDPTVTVDGGAQRARARSTCASACAIVVADDGSAAAEHVAACDGSSGIEVDPRRGATRLRRQRQPRPARRRRERRRAAQLRRRSRTSGWLECLQYAAYARATTSASSAPSCCIPTGASSRPAPYRNLGAPEWFDHRYRFKPADSGPANMPARRSRVTGACMYVKRAR